MPTYIYDGYCGLYCGACEVLLATRGGRVEELAEAQDMDPAELVCRGCKSEHRAVYCRGCELRECAEGRGVELCADCNDLPCDRLQAFAADAHSHHSAVLANLERARKVGRERWLEEQRQRWSCSCCQVPFSWYDERCPECGSSLYDCRMEEADLED